MLWIIFVVALVLWLLGMVGGFGGPLIHVLPVIAAGVLIYNLVTRRRVTL